MHADGQAEAEDHVRIIAEAAPEQPVAGWTRLARLMGDLGDETRARHAWEQVLAASPNDLRALRHLATMDYRGRLPTQAIPALKAIIALAPDDLASWRRLAQVLDMAGDLHGAEDAFRAVLRLAGGDKAAQAAIERLVGDIQNQPRNSVGPRGSAQIRVVAAPRGKHMFRMIEDDRVGLYSVFGPEAENADILLLPCGTAQAFRQSWVLAAALPDTLRRRIAAGDVGVVLDASTEGENYFPERSESLHGLIDLTGAAPRKAVYVTQDRGYEADYAAHSGRGPADRMAIMHYDLWIWRFHSAFRDNGEALFEERRALFDARPSRRERRFISLNFMPRPSKVAFLLSLIRDGVWDQGFISFGGFEAYCSALGLTLDTYPAHIAAEPGFETLARSLAPYLPQLDSVGRVYLEAGMSTRKAPIGDDTTPAYGQSWFTAVTETEMYGRPQRITEKPFKALVNFHPILVFGNPGALRMVRDLGFETFPELFDESYDEEWPARSRFEMVYAQFLRLCRMDEAELVRLEACVHEKLIHNARWGLTRFPRDYKARNDADLIDRLLVTLRA